MRSLRRTALALLTAAILAGSAVALTASPAAAAGDGTKTGDGRGYGHGRGLSQYGAEGYARSGWGWTQILDYYYGGTSLGDVATTPPPVKPGYVKIRLQRMSGRPTQLTITNGYLKFAKELGLPSNLKTVHLFYKGDSGFDGYEVYGSTSATCGTALQRYGNTSTRSVVVGKTIGDSGNPDDHIKVCPVPSSDPLTNNVSIWYPGSLQVDLATDKISPTGYIMRTSNITTIEKQLRSVVPNESPASWDLDALKAQSVAARSYALSAVDSRFGAADTCDTTYCQVYLGWFSDKASIDVRRVGQRSIWTTSDTRTDRAITETAGKIRVKNGAVARTEFHSTSGGWTAGPEMRSAFPAVEDKGDSISPLHTWTSTVSVAPLEGAYGWKNGTKGRLLSIDVTKRNGRGVGGGRVIEAVLRFSNGATKTTDGNDIRSRLRLRSDWFFPACGADQVEYLNATFQLFVQRSTSTGEVQDWCGRVGSATGRQQLTQALSVTDEWAGVKVRALYAKILDRSLDSEGYAYWMDQVRSGVPIERIAAYFYGGNEYFERAGSTNGRFLDRLYRDLLGRPSDDQGRAYWLPKLDSGQLSRTDVATNFYASIESRTSRVHALYLQILGRRADSSGLQYWTDQLLRSGDIALSSWLASSDEYYRQVTR